MSTKWVRVPLLFFLLGMPVAFYIFLQSFGENEYDLPVLYEDGIPDPIPGCAENRKPHAIEQLVNEGPCQSWDCSDIDGKLVIFSFAKMGCTTTHLGEIARICNIYRNQSLFHAVTVPLDSEVQPKTQDQNASLYGLSQDIWSWWPYYQNVASLVQCGFNLNMDCNTSDQVVLVDSLFQIRGYYLASDLQEMDRLVTEIKLLLMNMDS